ncbi:MAG TPA: hypothetical protein VEB66_18355 [Opitutaceae bacterium]|nr:hypothetical protein [Opitutaceae bacterium]
MDLKHLAGQICDEADDFLGDTTRPAEARAGIAEWLTIHQPALASAEKQAVLDEAMLILQREGFFERTGGGGDAAPGGAGLAGGDD